MIIDHVSSSGVCRWLLTIWAVLEFTSNYQLHKTLWIFQMIRDYYKMFWGLRAITDFIRHCGYYKMFYDLQAIMSLLADYMIRLTLYMNFSDTWLNFLFMPFILFYSHKKLQVIICQSTPPGLCLASSALVTHLCGPRTAKPWVTDDFFIVTVFLWRNGGQSSIALRGHRHQACQRRGGGCVLERVLEPCRL